MRYSVIHNDQITFVEDKSLGRLVPDVVDDFNETRFNEIVNNDYKMIGKNNNFYVNSDGKLIVAETKEPEFVPVMEFTKRTLSESPIKPSATTPINTGNRLIQTLTQPKNNLNPSDSPPIKPEEKTETDKTNTRKKGGWIILGSAIVLASALAIEHFSESKSVEGFSGIFWKTKKTKKSKAKPKKKAKKSPTKKSKK